jgi:hypothetical protein
MNTFALRAIRLATCGWLLVGPAAFAGTVYGEVVTGKGKPSAATISFIDEAGNVETAQADAKGHYELTLQPGTYRIASDAGTVSPATIVVFHEPRQQPLVIAEAR